MADLHLLNSKVMYIVMQAMFIMFLFWGHLFFSLYPALLRVVKFYFCVHKTVSLVHLTSARYIQEVMRGHGGRVVTLSPPTSEAEVRSPSWPQVGKLVVACCWSAVYSTEP